MQVHVRVCRECGEEYRPHIVSCADCGGELEDVYEDEGAPSPRQEPTEETEVVDLSGHRAIFQSGHATDLVPMAERLKIADMEFRMVEEAAPGTPSRFGLYVPETDVKKALEKLGDLLAPHTDSDAVHALETSYESGRYVRCPACGTEQGSGLSECSECGLALGVAVPACEKCESPLEEEGAECTVCGGPSPTG